MINLCSRQAAGVPSPEWTNWKWQVKHSACSLAQLSKWIVLPLKERQVIRQVAERYPFKITPHYLSLARKPSLSDPILKQCLPGFGEFQAFSGESPDPFREMEQAPVPGLIRRYRDRALVLASNHCAVLCRHCFRKRLWHEPGRPLNNKDLGRIVEYLSANPEIREIIVSGGDPLMLEDDALENLLGGLRQARNIDVIRIATRLPATLPQRITDDLCRTIARHSPVWIATHFNHPYELNQASAAACRKLTLSGVPIVSQTVLLQGINDDFQILRDLFTGLLKIQVKPYYMFHGDPASGTMHFRVSVERGRKLMRQLRNETSGLAIPLYAADKPGADCKVPLEVQTS